MVRCEEGYLDVKSGYGLWAESYDRDCWLAEVVDPICHAAIQRLACGNAIDLGCGTGRNLPALASQCESVVGVDFCKAMLERARARCSSLGNVRLVESDIQLLPLLSAAADFVVACIVLDHIPELRPLFVSVAKILRPGGKFFVIDLHPYFELYRQRYAGFEHGGRERRIVVYPHTFSEYLCAAGEAGLRISAIHEPTSRELNLPDSLAYATIMDVPFLFGLEMQKAV